MHSDSQEKTPIQKREFWEEQIRFWQESGLSQSEYCKRHGIRTSQWYYWKRRCWDTEADLTLVPLKLPLVSGHTQRASMLRVITPNGFTIELDADAPITFLPRLIREVSAI
jgi:transposase